MNGSERCIINDGFRTTSALQLMQDVGSDLFVIQTGIVVMDGDALAQGFMNGLSQDVIEVRFSAKYQCKTVDGVIAIIHEHLDIIQNAGAEILGFINSK